MDKLEQKRLCEQVGDRIRSLRRQKGLTAEALAEATGISPQYVSELEHGKKNMSMTIFFAVAEALGVSTDYLLHGDMAGGDREKNAAIMAQRLGEMRMVDRDLAILMLEKALEVLEGMGLERY